MKKVLALIVFGFLFIIAFTIDFCGFTIPRWLGKPAHSLALVAGLTTEPWQEPARKPEERDDGTFSLWV